MEMPKTIIMKQDGSGGIERGSEFDRNHTVYVRADDEKSGVVSRKRECTGSICEWKLMSTTPYAYVMQCDDSTYITMADHFGLDDTPEFKFCPYCGNEIKYK